MRARLKAHKDTGKPIDNPSPLRVVKMPHASKVKGTQRYLKTY